MTFGTCAGRYTLRSFRQNPTFTLVPLVSLAIGTAPTYAAFSWADAPLLRPLTVPRPSEVISVGSTTAIDRAIASLLRVCARRRCLAPSVIQTRRATFATSARWKAPRHVGLVSTLVATGSCWRRAI